MRTHQIIHFVGNQKRTLFDIVGVKDNEFTQLKLADGRKVLINKQNVLMIEVFSHNDKIAMKTWGEMFRIYSANEDNNK